MPKKGDKREDGKVWYGRWLSEEQLEKRKAQQKMYERKYYEKNKEVKRAKTREWQKSNPDRKKLIDDAWYRNNAKYSNERKKYWSTINNPVFGLRDAISKFRSGAIGIDELNRRYDEAIKRANEVSCTARKGK